MVVTSSYFCSGPEVEIKKSHLRVTLSKLPFWDLLKRNLKGNLIMDHLYPQGRERKGSDDLESTCSKRQGWFVFFSGWRECLEVRNLCLGKGRKTETAQGHQPSLRSLVFHRNSQSRKPMLGNPCCSTRQSSEPHLPWLALLVIAKLIRILNHPVGNLGCKASSHWQITNILLEKIQSSGSQLPDTPSRLLQIRSP